MADQLQLRGGTTAQHAAFTGALREVTVDTDKDTVVVHDNATVGGFPLLRQDLSNLPAGTIDNADINASAAIAGTKISPDFGSQTIASTGVFSHPLGAAATPSLTFTGDLNTGIYSPGADQVAVATNGTGRLFVDASGNVGIGSTSPEQLLHLLKNQNGSTGFLVDNQWGTSGASASLTLKTADVAGSSTATFTIDKYKNGSVTIANNETNSAGNLSFNVGSSERLRITSAGLVGIGTSTPANIFHAHSASSNSSTIQLTNNTTGVGAGDGMQIVTSDSEMQIRNRENGVLNFWTNNTKAVTIDTSQRVGIGTTSVSSNLDVRGSGAVYSNIGSTNAGGAYLFLDGNANGDAGGGDYAQISHLSGGELQINNLQAQPLTFRTSNTERARIDSSGRLLVGASVAYGSTDNLVVQKTDGSARIGLQHSATGEVTAGVELGAITFYSNDGDLNPSARISAEADSDHAVGDKPGRLTFSTTADGASSPTERMRIGNKGSTQFLANDQPTSFIISDTGVVTSEKLLECRHTASMGGGTTCLVIRRSGNVENLNNSYGAYSDLKLKENIIDASSQWDDLKALQVRNYNFKEGQTHTQIGLVAQEVELVSPGLVSESPDRDEDGNDLGTVTKSVNYSVLYMKAVKALQEAMERIESLEAKVAALESA